MNEWLASKQFKEIVIPLISTIVTILIKVVSRKDHSLSFKLEDFNVGFDLLVASGILLTTYGSKMAYDLQTNNVINTSFCYNKLQQIPYIICIFLIILFSLSTFVRAWGWRVNRNNELRIFTGIVIPDVIGVISLLWTTNFIE